MELEKQKAKQTIKETNIANLPLFAKELSRTTKPRRRNANKRKIKTGASAHAEVFSHIVRTASHPLERMITAAMTRMNPAGMNALRKRMMNENNSAGRGHPPIASAVSSRSVY